MKEYDLEIKSYEEAIEINPKYDKAYYKMGIFIFFKIINKNIY